LLSLPASFIIPALMIIMRWEIFKRDANLSLGTLSVRIEANIVSIFIDF
jgi:1,4-dihydroxy-2-naphthoate octaprenyltransferase